jgi:RNA polymerase subunit RPABC4/transcription elongation factor Spt4
MPNPLLWVQNSCLVWFRAISLSYVTHSQNGCRGAYKARLLPSKPFLRFSQQTCPIHYFRSKTHVWCGFALFHCRTSPIPKTGVGVHTKHEFLPLEPFLRFSQRTCPIHYFRSKTHVWVGFAQFRCRTSPIPETGVRVDTKHEFSPPEPFLCFSQRNAQSTTLGPNSCLVWFRAIWLPHVTNSKNGCQGAYTARVFATGTISLFFSTNMPNPLL